MTGIGAGGPSFAELREQDGCYVDKTLPIKDLLDADDCGVYLFTRPRGFGKTTNLSMLDAFFNREYEGKTWFDGLEISKHRKYDGYRHAFPVIHLDLGNTGAGSYDSFLGKMREAVRDAFEPHRRLLEWPDLREPARRIFRHLDEGDTGREDIVESINLLSSSLNSYHGKKPVILIDEYDRAISDPFGESLREPASIFLRELLYESTKGNDNRELVFITGTMQTAQESILSDLNNLRVNNIFSTMSDERFGFTENETRSILEHYGGEGRFDEARQWYGGYVFGNAEVCNPRSIMRYASNGFVPAPYWENDESEIISMKLFESLNNDNLSDVIGLLTGGCIEKELSRHYTYGAATAGNKALYSLMAMAGYLRAVPMKDERDRTSIFPWNGDLFRISIPNEEVRRVVDSVVESVIPIDAGYFSGFVQAVLRGDAESMEKRFGDILARGNGLSLRKNAYEIIMVMLMHSLLGRYRIEAEHKSGFGRTDIVLRPKDETHSPIVFELKTSKKAEDLTMDAEDAIKQIHDMQYYRGMPGDVRIYGISFFSNTLKVLTETVRNDPRGMPVVMNGRNPFR